MTTFRVSKMPHDPDSTAGTGHQTKESKVSSTTIKADLHEFISQVSLACAHWIVDSVARIWRLFWLVMVVGAVVLTMVFLIKTISNFMNPREPYRTNSVIAHLDRHANGEVDLPDFAFCLTKPWNVERAIAHNISMPVLSYLSNFLYPIGSPRLNASDWKMIEMEYNKTLAQFQYNLTRIMDLVTYSCADVVVECTAKLQSTNGTACCANKLDSGHYVNGGKCFSTLGKDKTKIVVPWKSFGDTFTLDLKLKNHSLLMPFRRFGSQLLGQIGQVWVGGIIHPSDLLMMLDNSVMMLPKSANYIGFNKKEYDRTDIKSDIKMFAATGLDLECGRDTAESKYSYPTCFVQSLKNVTMASLQCTLFAYSLPYDASSGSNSYCTPSATSALMSTFLSSDVDAVPDLMTICKTACIDVKYEHEKTSIPIPDVEDDLVSFVVHHKTFDYTKVSFNGKKAEEFIGVIGGNLGIFCGACLLTILEVIVFIFQQMLKTVRGLF